jgi:NitT/TauT family transport system ATP-binding protein
MGSIQLKNLDKTYGNTKVLNNYSIELQENKITCLMGPSGVGKTTLLQILLGLVKVDKGKISGLDGKKVSAVFQENRLIEGIDAIHNIKLVCDKQVTEDMIENELSLVGLTEYKNKPVSKLSGGMQRRVAIVRAIMARSDLVIMDEPFKGLDENLKKQVIQYVMNKTMGKTVLMVTHDKEEVELLSAELVVME